MLPTLKEQVAQGDAAAACRIAFELERCRRMPSLRDLPGFWEQAFLRLTAKKNSNAEWFVENAKRQLAQAEKACEGLPAEAVDETFDYALVAALAGNRQARWMMTAWPVGLDLAHPERTLEGWALWRQHIRSIEEAGVAAGDPRIVSTVARDLLQARNGFRIFEPDAVRAAGLELALVPAASPSNAAGVESRANAAIRSLGDDASAVAAARAIAAATLLPQAPEGGFDWSRGMTPSADGTECERER